MKFDGSSVSVIVCGYTFDRWADICNAVNSIQAQSMPPREVILVVDNNPQLMLRLEARFPECRVIANAEEPGLSGARNTGIGAASGHFLAFLDDDAVAPAGWIEGMLRSFSDSRVLGVTTRVVPAWEGPGPNWFPGEFLWVVGCTNKDQQRGAVRNLLGASMCITRAVFERVGGFDSRLGRRRLGLPMGCEETEICMRAAAAIPAARFVYDDSVAVRHKVGTGRQTWRYFMRRCFAEGLSKSRFAGLEQRGGLRTEWNYVTGTLATGFFGALFGGLLSLDADRVLAALAIVGGLAAATAGFLYGRLGDLLHRDRLRPSAAVAAAMTKAVAVHRKSNDMAERFRRGSAAMIGAARHHLANTIPAMLQAARARTVLISNAAFVSIGAVTSAVFGFLFWSIAARQLPAETIGMTSAVISAMALVATMSEIGLGTLLMGPVLKRRDAAPGIISAALIVALLVAYALCHVWLAISNMLALRLGDILGTRIASLLFIAGTLGTVLSLVIDSASTGLLVSWLRMFRELAFAAGKLVLLIVVLAATGSGGGPATLLLAWVAASLISLYLMARLARHHDITLFATPDFRHLLKLSPASLDHHALNLVATAPTMVLPILVTEVVSPEVNAAFFLALLILQVLLLGPASISSALYAVSGSEPSERKNLLRFSLLLATLMSVAEMIAYILLLNFILGLINPAYPTLAGPHMSYIGLAAPARSVKFFYIAVARLDGRMRQGAGLLAVCGALEISGAAIGALVAGAPGLVIGWLVSAYVELGILLPTVLTAAFARPRPSQIAATATSAASACSPESTPSSA